MEHLVLINYPTMRLEWSVQVESRITNRTFKSKMHILIIRWELAETKISINISHLLQHNLEPFIKAWDHHP